MRRTLASSPQRPATRRVRGARKPCVWLLFGGVGILVSGQIGALAEPFGLGGVYLGIAAGCTLAACAAIAFRNRFMGLPAP